jgi:hypothetical protein
MGFVEKTYDWEAITFFLLFLLASLGPLFPTDKDLT